MKNILRFIADKTYGESYSTSKLELYAENSSAPIDYDLPTEIVLKRNGETRPPKNYASLEAKAKNISDAAQILNYFLDGTLRVYKVDDIAYRQGSRKMIYPIVAAQVTVGNCRRVDKKLRAENLSDEIILVLPDVANRDAHEGFFPALLSSLNAQLAEKFSPIRLAKILQYNTNHNPAEKFEDRAVAKVMEHMHNAEINLVAELVRRGKLDQKNYLLKDGSLEYRVLPGDKKKFNAKNYSFVVGVSKKFNPARIKDSADKINPGLVAELPTFCRTPVTICERGTFHDGNKIALWYLRLRDRKLSDSPFDGVIKVEKILVTDEELRTTNLKRFSRILVKKVHIYHPEAMRNGG